MSKVVRFLVDLLVITALCSGTVLAADGNGIRPESSTRTVVCPMADGNGIRPY